MNVTPTIQREREMGERKYEGTSFLAEIGHCLILRTYRKFWEGNLVIHLW
jgi:hypothetical protein